METTIKTSFNFAKEIQCNFITKNNPEHSYPGGLPEFITPYLQVLPVESLILILFKALSKTLSKTSNQTTITKSQSQT